MEHIKKRLVFYFYGFNGYKESRAVQIHLKCLKYYSHIFDEALFIISVDNANDTELIADIEKSLIGCGFNDIRFKVHQNNSYCESQPFYDEVFSKLSSMDGLTFIGHTKGVTNYGTYPDSENSIDNWLLGMYYLNLEYIDEVEYSLCHDVARFYGAFLQKIGEKTNKYQYVYSGTFYWINCPMLYNDIQVGEVELAQTYHHRGYVEGIPGNSFDWREGENLASHDRKILFRYDEYRETNDGLISFLTGEDYPRYCEFKQEILDF